MTVRSGTPADNLNGLSWRKSQHSSPQGNCVEIAALPFGQVAVRDSHEPTGPTLTFAKAEWRALTNRAKEGYFDW